MWRQGRRHSILVKTDGTDENLEALEGRLGNSQKVSAQTNQAIQKAGAKHADLATAQADVIADTVAQSSASSARTVAALYPDVFQLVVRDAKAPLTNQPFSSLKGKKIEVPNRGGQLTSFLSIAEHYGWKEKDFVFLTKDDTKKAFCNNELDAVFRVRALGNREISDMLACGGQLLPIRQGAAMKIQHPAFQTKGTIPEGAYKGESPIPAGDLETISVQRLLLARSDVSERLIQEITVILNEHRQEIAEQIKDKEVRPLVTYIGEPSTVDSAGVSLHPGAFNFYNGNKSTFSSQYLYLNIIALMISIVSFGASVLWKVNVRLKKERKNQADEYIKEVVELMKSETKLNELFDFQTTLEKTFQNASNDLRNEKISQESFRTFNEAYKTSREFIERTIQEKQRQVSADFVKQVMNLLDQQASRDELLRELNQQLKQAKEQLTQDKTFSRESFRTFVEAYNVVRDSLNSRYSNPI